MKGWEDGDRMIGEATDREERRKSAELERKVLQLRIDEERARIDRAEADRAKAKRLAEEKAGRELAVQSAYEEFCKKNPTFRFEDFKGWLFDAASTIMSEQGPNIPLDSVFEMAGSRVMANLEREAEESYRKTLERVAREGETARIIEKNPAYSKHAFLREALTIAMDTVATDYPISKRDWRVIAERSHDILSGKYPEFFPKRSKNNKSNRKLAI